MRLFALFSPLILAMIIIFPQNVIAQTDPLQDLCTRNPGASACQARDPNQSAGDNRVVDVLSFVIDTLSWVIGIAAVIAVIIGGVLYAISGGDPQRTTQARNAIIYALVGIVIAAFAQLIIFFVLDRLNL